MSREKWQLKANLPITHENRRCRELSHWSQTATELSWSLCLPRARRAARDQTIAFRCAFRRTRRATSFSLKSPVRWIKTKLCPRISFYPLVTLPRGFMNSFRSGSKFGRSWAAVFHSSPFVSQKSSKCCSRRLWVPGRRWKCLLPLQSGLLSRHQVRSRVSKSGCIIWLDVRMRAT